MYRKVIFKKDKLISGVAKLAEAVGSTLGPKGQTVLIETDEGHPYITKDGVTVCGFVRLKDPLERLASTIVSQSAQATVRAAGDGTTTSIVLANEIIQLAHTLPNPVDVIKGIEAASAEVIGKLEEQKEDMTPEMIQHIARVSSNNDDEVAGIITQAFLESGDDGIVDVELDPASSEITLDVRSGSFVSEGFTNTAFVNNIKKQVCELENALVLVSDLTIDDHTKILHLLEHAITEAIPLIIIANTEKNFDEAFIMNIGKKILKGCIIRPGGMTTSDKLKDLAKLLNATYFDNSHGNNLEHISVEDLGAVDKAVIGHGFTLFSTDNPGDVTENIEAIRSRLEVTTNGLEKKALKERLSMLNGKYATIKVGAPTEVRLHEVKDRIDDAVQAVGAAEKGGYLSGGGVALRDLANSLGEPKGNKGRTSFSEGYRAFVGALKAPEELILNNAGIKERVNKIGEGIDATCGKPKDMIKAGIIDPAFVTIQAVKNATSSAVALLSTRATIIKDD